MVGMKKDIWNIYLALQKAVIIIIIIILLFAVIYKYSKCPFILLLLLSRGTPRKNP